MTVLRTSQHRHESWVTMYQLYCTTASESQHIKTQKGYVGKGGVGPGATVGTPRTGYPRVQASSQDNGSRLPLLT
jgi:hypothetical protein